MTNRQLYEALLSYLDEIDRSKRSVEYAVKPGTVILLFLLRDTSPFEIQTVVYFRDYFWLHIGDAYWEMIHVFDFPHMLQIIDDNGNVQTFGELV